MEQNESEKIIEGQKTDESKPEKQLSEYEKEQILTVVAHGAIKLIVILIEELSKLVCYATAMGCFLFMIVFMGIILEVLHKQNMIPSEVEMLWTSFMNVVLVFIISTSVYLIIKTIKSGDSRDDK